MFRWSLYGSLRRFTRLTFSEKTGHNLRRVQKLDTQIVNKIESVDVPEN
jgi:hypothetical protein